MDRIVADFLFEKQTNVLKLSTTLTEKQDQVIESFGGITNVVYLCLTHPNASQYIDIKSQQFEVLQQLLHLNDANNDESKNANQTSHNDLTINTISNSNQNSSSDSKKSGSDNINTSVSMNNKIIQSVNNTSQYKHSKLIINCDPKYNLLFKWIKNTNITLSWYNTILNLKFVMTLICLLCICGTVMMIHLYIFSIQSAYIICKITASLIVICYCISILLIANITLVDLITSTFDFWFKLYNIVVLAAAVWIRSHETYHGVNDDDNPDPVWNNKFEFGANVMMHIGVFSATIVLFLLDAIPLSIKLKRFGIGLYVIVFISEVIKVYFFRQDFEWNPFNSKYTQISFKSIIISSQINLILFMVKPVFSDTIRYLKRYISLKLNFMSSKSHSNSTGDDIKSKRNVIVDKYKYQRCGTVYKRPYLKWNKFESAINNEIKLDEIVSK